MGTYAYKIADSLARKGVPVFPLAENTKVPLKGSQGYKDATTDAEQVKAWFAGADNYNVGMALKPINLLVIDLDRNHESGFNGVETFADLCKRYGESPQGGYVMATPRNGVHWFLKYPKGLEIPSKPLSQFSPELAEFKGIDVVTYSTPAPLAKTDSGTYKVVGDPALYSSPLDAAECPAWLLGLLTAKSQQTAIIERSQAKTWTGRLIDELFQPQADEGTRNVYLTSLCGKLLRSTAKASAVYEALRLANERLPNPLPDDEVNKIFRSVLKRDNQRKGAAG
ncbi:bifunctional DNA primase/polymerase [uncultured Secundilactobacillus sp.]|uniref:bifunctional DNA primase/polymerase n=1 Tax=uncultured Secundilactobacillus sp. TaxID=2813935 RepID=UPI002586BFB3|nr:bifunctional DNA primase/polymerase [uncultured Secundilactobacillus sp.]